LVCHVVGRAGLLSYQKEWQTIGHFSSFEFFIYILWHMGL